MPAFASTKHSALGIQPKVSTKNSEMLLWVLLIGENRSSTNFNILWSKIKAPTYTVQILCAWAQLRCQWCNYGYSGAIGAITTKLVQLHYPWFAQSINLDSTLFPLLKVRWKSGHIAGSAQYSPHKKSPEEHKLSGALHLKSWQRPTFTWGSPTLSLALSSFTSEFGMGSGGSYSLWLPGNR